MNTGGKDWVLFAVVALFALNVVGCVHYIRLKNSIAGLCYLAIAARMLGAGLYYEVVHGYYAGTGDSASYFLWGLQYAERVRSLDFSLFADASLRRTGHLWGTPIIDYTTAILVAVFGPKERAFYLMFSLLSFIGLIGFAKAIRESFGDAALLPYAAAIWLFPSLWFWPSTIGKDAVALCGIGLCTAGFAGKRGRMNVPLMAFGLLLIVAVRPHIAALLALSMAAAYWLARERKLSWLTILKRFAILTASLAVAGWGLKLLGLREFSFAPVLRFIEIQAATSSFGGSAVVVQGNLLERLPIGVFNVFMRPLPWEARGITGVASSLELVAFWVFFWFGRASVRRVWRERKHNRMVWFAVVVVVFGALVLGVTLANIGLIARQRTFLFPFLLMFPLARIRAEGTKQSRTPQAKTHTAELQSVT